MSYAPRTLIQAHRRTHRRFFISSIDPGKAEHEQRAVVKALADAPDTLPPIPDYFFTKTRELIDQASWSSVGPPVVKNVDITRDVLRFVPIHWACQMVRRMSLIQTETYSLPQIHQVGIPLRAEKDPHASGFTPKEMWDMLTDIYS